MKRLLIGLSLLVLLSAGMILGAYVYLNAQDAEKMRRLLETGLESATGRAVSLNGVLVVRLSPLPVVEVGDATLGNAPWASRQEMLTIETLEVRPDLIGLLTGRIVLDQLRIRDARLYLENGPAGQGNWQFQPRQKTKDSELAVSVHSLQIQNLHASYSNPSLESPREIFLDNVALSAREEHSPIRVEIQGNILDLPLNVSGDIGRFRDLIAGRSFPVKLSASLGDTSLEASGQIDDPDFRDYKGIHLDLKVTGKRPVVLKAWSSLDIPPVDHFQIAGSLVGSDGELGLRNVQAAFGSGGYRLSMSGAIAHLPDFKGVALDFEGNGDRIVHSVPWSDEALDLSGHFTAKGHLAGDAGKLRLEPIKFSADIDGGKLEGQGTLSDIGSDAQGDGRVSISSSDPARFGSQLRVPMPSLDDFELTGRLRGPVASLEMTDIRATLSRASLKGHVSGSIGSLDPLKAVALTLDVAGNNFAELSVLFGIDGLPQTDTASATAHIRGGWNDLALVFDDLELLRQDGTRLQATGSIVNLTGARSLDMGMHLTGVNLQTLETTPDNIVPATDSYSIKGRLSGPLTSPDLEKVDAHARLGDTSLNMTGELPRVLDFKSVDARIEATGDDLSALGDKLGLKLPGSRSFSFSGRAVGGTDKPRIEDLTGDLKTDQVNLSFAGRVQDILAGQGFDLNIQAEAPTLTPFLPFGGYLWDELGESTATFSLTGNPEKFQVDLEQLKAGSSSLTGSFTYSRPANGQQRRIDGAFEKSTLDLTPWIERNGRADSGNKNGEADGKPASVFSLAPLPLHWMDTLEMDVDLSALRLIFGKSFIDLVRGKLNLENRSMSLDPVTLKYEEADIDGSLTLAGGEAPGLKLTSVTKGLDLGDLARRAGLSDQARGLIDLRLDLDTRGNSAHEMAQSARGQLTLLLTDGFVGGADLPLNFADMFLHLMPWLKERRGMTIECGMLDLPVAGGIADINFLVLDTADMLMRGTGKVDLGQETYDVLLVPRAKRARALAAKVDVHVKGPLRSPKIRYDAATTGLGLLETAGRFAILGPAGLFVGSDTFRKQRQKCAQSLDTVGEMK